MEHFFYNIYQYIKSHKTLAIGVFASLFLVLVALSSRLNFEEDITKLIPENEDAAILNKILNQVDFSDKIIVHFTTEEPNSDLTKAAAEFKDELENSCNEYITEVQGVVNDDDLDKTLNFVYDNLPLFLNEDDYKQISERMVADTLKTLTKSNYKSLISPSGFVTRQSILRDPLGLTFLGLKKLKDLQVGDEFIIDNGFVVTKDKKDLLLFIKPKLPPNETDKNTAFVSQLNKIQTALNAKYNSQVSYYGATLIAVANANQIKHDIQFTVSVALSILLIILMVFYKRLSLPIILFIPTVFGALLAITVLYVLRGSISAISIGIGSVLLGITLDFSLHILTHYRSNTNVKELYKDVTKPIVMSSITTAMAFLCLLFVKSRALQDLGIFAAVSVFGASFFALVLIPHLYREKPQQLIKKTSIDALANYDFSKSKLLIGLSIVIGLITAFTYSDVVFDKDISKMNFQTTELLEEEQQLDNLLNTTSKSIYLVAHSPSLNDALATNDSIYRKLKRLKLSKDIINYSSSASVVLSEQHQQQKFNTWADFWTEEQQTFLKSTLISEGEKYGLKPSAFDDFYSKMSLKPTVQTLSDYQKVDALNAKEFITEKKGFYTVLSSLKVSNQHINTVKNHFDKMNNVVVIDRQAMNETFLSTFKNNFNTLLLYSFVAVLVVLMLFFKRIELVLITMTPIAITWIITLGIMGLLGLSFNIFNIIISTFIFGLGVDYAIFTTNGLIKEYETGEEHLPVYRTSILLSVLTTILGVGVLIFAKHPALHSIAIVCLIGISVALLITLTLQPLMFRAIITNRSKNGFAPLELRKTIHSLISFAFYGLGGMLLSLIAITILKILPINKKSKFKWLHKAMAKLATSVLYSNPFVSKKKFLNKEMFEEQAVIIANHTSFLDTLAIALVTPKVIFLVNDWVYKSPIFGQLAKVAGYYPVSSGVDGSLEHLKVKMKQGYSLVVFPEGKRMYSNKMGRFHKGAFFLAQELKLEILPLYIHGNSEVLPKGDFIIYDGSITVKLGDRIDINNPQFGETIKEKTKSISHLFRSQFQMIRNEIETSSYFKKLILSNYLYKSHHIGLAVKNDLNQYIDSYAQVSKHIALDAKILHIANDYGQLDLLLNYYSNSRKIYSYITNTFQRQIATHNFIGKDRIINYVADVNISRPIDTLICSTHFSVDTLDMSSISTVVILHNCIDINVFIEQQYAIKFQDDAVIIVSKM